MPNLFVGEINEKTTGLIAFETVVFTFIVHLFLNTVYAIENTSLKIRCGVFSYRPIDINLIKTDIAAIFGTRAKKPVTEVGDPS